MEQIVALIRKKKAEFKEQLGLADDHKLCQAFDELCEEIQTAPDGEADESDETDESESDTAAMTSAEVLGGGQ